MPEMWEVYNEVQSENISLRENIADILKENTVLHIEVGRLTSKIAILKSIIDKHTRFHCSTCDIKSSSLYHFPDYCEEIECLTRQLEKGVNS